MNKNDNQYKRGNKKKSNRKIIQWNRDIITDEITFNNGLNIKLIIKPEKVTYDKYLLPNDKNSNYIEDDFTKKVSRKHLEI